MVRRGDQLQINRRVLSSHRVRSCGASGSQDRPSRETVVGQLGLFGSPQVTENMAKENTAADRRAQHVAALGFVLQTMALGLLIGLSIWKHSDAVATLARFVAAGIPIWVILFLVFKQLTRVAAEQLESAELRRAQQAGASDAIFELDDEALLIEQNKLRWMIRLLLPGVTVVIALVFLVGHFVGWGWTLQNVFKEGGFSRSSDPTLLMWFIVVSGFVCFMFSRGAIGLAQLPNFRLLRAGASYMAAIAVGCLLLAISLMAAESFPWTEPLFSYIVRVAMIVLGIEFAANFVLDFYRPRAAGVVPRPSFDSRLLGLIGEPGSIAKSIADTVNYQFGFEVSSTWFYQLLQRCLFPLMVGTCVIVIALSSVVVVNADEQVIVERWGQPLGNPPTILSPGIHLKMPFPIDAVQRAPVRRIKELVIGEAGDSASGHAKEAILWTKSHDFVPEMMLLVGSAEKEEGESPPPSSAFPGTEPQEPTETDGAGRSVPVALLMVSVPIEYRVKDIRKFLYKYMRPEKIMEETAYRFLSDYAASVDIDALMGPQRGEFNKALKAKLQERLDALDTGIEIVFAGLRDAHPPAQNQVAEAFLNVITAQTTKAATINAAEGEAHKILTAVAGTSARAKALDQAIVAFRAIEADPKATPQQIAEAKQRAEDLLMGNAFKGISQLSGEAAKQIGEARAAASRRVATAAAKVRAFSAEVAAYEAAPGLYVQRKLLEPYRAIGAVRKYMIVGDPDNVIIEYETEKQIGLDRILEDEKQ